MDNSVPPVRDHTSLTRSQGECGLRPMHKGFLAWVMSNLCEAESGCGNCTSVPIAVPLNLLQHAKSIKVPGSRRRYQPQSDIIDDSNEGQGGQTVVSEFGQGYIYVLTQ